jgi:hypothetical protein
VSTAWNIYCDESSHLELDKHTHMVMGAVTCPKDKARGIAERIREIKVKHGLPRDHEVKWTKVSPGKLEFYKEVVDFFFDDDDLGFRAVVIDKSQLDHKTHNQTHETFYYKMYFRLLSALLDPEDCYFIYLDIKDSRSASKTRKLGDILANNSLDFQREIVRNIQNAHSDELEQMQLTDLLVGAVGYVNRGFKTSAAKLDLIKRIRKRSGYQLNRSTLRREQKMNLFMWRGASGGTGVDL